MQPGGRPFAERVLPSDPPVLVRAALSLVLLATTPTAAQTLLEVGVPVEADLGAGGSHAYALPHNADQFVAGSADQQTVAEVMR